MPLIITELTSLSPNPKNYLLYHNIIDDKDLFSLKNKNVEGDNHFSFKPLNQISINNVVFSTAQELITAFNLNFNQGEATPQNVNTATNSITGTVKTDITEADPVVYTKTTMDSLLGAKADLVGGKVPASQLPSYVDDVVEVANFGALPITGESGKIYVTIDNNKQYRWTGTVYVEFTAGVSDHTLLTNIGTNTHAQIDTHIANTSNPHNVTKAQIGLGNVDNTSDADKPVSTAQNIAINAKVEDAIVNGVTTIAPSQNAVFDALVLKSNDTDVIHTTGDESKDGSLYIQDINNTGNAIIGDTSLNTAGTGVLGIALSGATVGQDPYGRGVYGYGFGTAVGVKGYSENGIGGWFSGRVKIATFREVTGTGPFVETERVYILASGLLKTNSIIINQTTDNGVDKLQVNGSTLSTAFKKTGDTDANILLAGGGVTALSGLATTTNLNNLFIDKEPPSGLINGTNTTFTLANTPILGSEHLYRNGILQESGAGNDYTISGNTITFLAAPFIGDKLRVTYRR